MLCVGRYLFVVNAPFVCQWHHGEHLMWVLADLLLVLLLDLVRLGFRTVLNQNRAALHRHANLIVPLNNS